jgi:hypothetical protein
MDNSQGGLNKTKSFASGEAGPELEAKRLVGECGGPELHFVGLGLVVELMKDIRMLHKEISRLRRDMFEGMPECHK